MLNLPPRCSCRANTQQQQQHPAVCTGHSSTRIARHTYAVYEARFLRKYPVYEYQQSVVCTVACIFPPSCTVAVARTRSRSSSLYRMLLCTCSSYTGICVTRLDVYVYQSVRIVVRKRVYEYWYHPPVITTTATTHDHCIEKGGAACGWVQKGSVNALC